MFENNPEFKKAWDQYFSVFYALPLGFFKSLSIERHKALSSELKACMEQLAQQLLIELNKASVLKEDLVSLPSECFEVKPQPSAKSFATETELKIALKHERKLNLNLKVLATKKGDYLIRQVALFSRNDSTEESIYLGIFDTKILREESFEKEVQRWSEKNKKVFEQDSEIALNWVNNRLEF